MRQDFARPLSEGVGGDHAVNAERQGEKEHYRILSAIGRLLEARLRRTQRDRHSILAAVGWLVEVKSKIERRGTERKATMADQQLASPPAVVCATIQLPGEDTWHADISLEEDGKVSTCLAMMKETCMARLADHLAKHAIKIQPSDDGWDNADEVDEEVDDDLVAILGSDKKKLKRR
ncbi:hypothetical protein CBR_g57846 [Chara braunii]|uniref:Uncharacterized protein n=1 Tax=Chara braunii TaxID=69332 RepID=A0A388K856_CHABU|nr:hypothetical protein CBR_g57846 [Chara braunii]|eukprot:GBG66244.1 hypothetical protein CBR_g57846 [Chara braunii]